MSALAYMPRPGSRTALGWALAVLLAGALSPPPGPAADEAAAAAAGEAQLAWWGRLAAGPAAALREREAVFRGDVEPPFPRLAAAATGAALRPLGLSRGTAERVAPLLAAAVLAALLAWLGGALAGGLGAILTPALFWLWPRVGLEAGRLAPALTFVALWLATALSWREALRALGRSAARRWAAASALLFGLALATDLRAAALLPLLALHALAHLALTAEAGRLTSPPPVALPAMAVAGPLVLVALWPALWADAQDHLLGAGGHLRATALPPGEGLLRLALSAPLAALAAMAAGLLHACGRLLAAVRRREAAAAGDESWLLLLAVAPLLLAAWPGTPFGAEAGWLPALPFLAALGARALWAAGHALWPERGLAVGAALGLLAVAPGARALLHASPHGALALGPQGGGMPGTASRGWPRQRGGEAAAGVLALLGERAVPGARVHWTGTSRLAMRAWQRDGRLRADLAWAEGPEEADLAVAQPGPGGADEEYRIWSAFRTARPVHGLFADEVPLVVVYARPGAWR